MASNRRLQSEAAKTFSYVRATLAARTCPMYRTQTLLCRRWLNRDPSGASLASAYALGGETRRAAAELAEAKRLVGDDRCSSIAREGRRVFRGVRLFWGAKDSNRRSLSYKARVLSVTGLAREVAHSSREGPRVCRLAGACMPPSTIFSISNAISSRGRWNQGYLPEDDVASGRCLPITQR